MSITVSPAKSSAAPADRRARMDVLFLAHAADVHAFAARRTTASAAEDVVSETFLVAWRRFDTVPDDPKPWLLGVARRVLANQRRAEGRQRALRERLEPNRQVPSHEATPSGTDEAVLAALASLSPVERDAITLLPEFRSWRPFLGTRDREGAGHRVAGVARGRFA